MLRSVMVWLGKVAVFLVVTFGLYLTYYWYDMKQLGEFCGAVKPGMPVSDLPTLAKQHHIDLKWFRGNGVYADYLQQWHYYVPSTASVGANVCAIGHDKMFVIAAQLQFD